MSNNHEDVKQKYFEDGYVVVEDVFDPDTDFAQLYDDWREILDDVIDGFIAEGLLTSRYEDLPFDQRLIAVTSESGRNFPRPFDIALPQKNIKADTQIYLGKGVFNLLTSPKLLNILEQVIGPEITANPVGHVRMKLPPRSLTEEGKAIGLIGSTPFHQDMGVVLPEADNSEIVSCWIAITDADEENGCLKVIPGTQTGGLLEHCADESFRGTRGIATQLLPDTAERALPMRAGSALLFRRTLVHGALDNVSADRVRISLDLRFQPTGQPTGRPDFPEFIARSKADPSSVLNNADEWANLWYATRERLAHEGTPYFNRWSKDSSLCA